MNDFVRLVLNSPRRIAMPIAVYPGAALTGASVRDLVTEPKAQFEAAAAIHHRFQTRVVLSAMDLSVEAEAFGCEIVMSDHEIPTVTGRLVADLDQAKALAVPTPGDRRTAVYLETVRLLKQLPGNPLVLAGSIGPFSLAGRIIGHTEAFALTLSDPDLLHLVVQKSADFLAAYARAFKAAGADGLIMAEPAAGLLSPRGMAAFSSAYVKQIIAAVADDRFAFILHNCGAKAVHWPALIESGASVFHFGAPMDIPAVLAKVSQETVICGNLDPTAVFYQSDPEAVAAQTRRLLAATTAHRNFVISSGCDVPPLSPLANLDAFFQTVADASDPV